ncbi:hypothetical protein [Chryseobacterium indoltheticum]|uniref:hypothetical protein n=1 Tax=Chryseobacterium indoltheticum TaxID=254 RepID=UPI003F494855
MQSQNDYNTALQAYNLQKRLYNAEIGKKTDYDMALQNLNYQKQRKQIVEKGSANEKTSETLSLQPLIIPSIKWKKVWIFCVLIKIIS